MKNSADLGGCYPQRPSASVDNTLLDLQNSSYPTQPRAIIAKYLFWLDSFARIRRFESASWLFDPYLALQQPRSSCLSKNVTQDSGCGNQKKEVSTTITFNFS